MKNAYIYVLDTLADWELGYVIAELNSGRFFKEQGEKISVKTVAVTKDPIKTMGGMTIVPDVTVNEITPDSTAVLLLAGADTWKEVKHQPIVEKFKLLLDEGITVGAICGATGAIAHAGILDDKPHTSNSLEYLKMVAPSYKGEKFYKDERAVHHDNLITANSTGGLLFARLILEKLDVFSKETLDAWYKYFDTGEAKYFLETMQSLPQKTK